MDSFALDYTFLVEGQEEIWISLRALRRNIRTPSQVLIAGVTR
jgi:hypothetical protein